MKNKIIWLMLLMATFNVLASELTNQPATQGNLDSSAALAKKLANPIADLVSAQSQYNWYQGAGANKDGHMQELIFQPVMPVSLTPDYNLIVRPVITGTQLTSVDGISNSGLSPTMIETFFTKNTNSDLIWGVGPFLQAPSNNQPYLGSQQWGGGASAILVYRPGHWTIGTLAYQSFDLGGPGTGGTANNTYVQPFLAYTADSATTVSFNTQTNYNWDARQSSIPLNLQFSQLFKLDKLPVQAAVGPSYWAKQAAGPGPTGWGVRGTLTFILPKFY